MHLYEESSAIRGAFFVSIRKGTQKSCPDIIASAGVMRSDTLRGLQNSHQEIECQVLLNMLKPQH